MEIYDINLYKKLVKISNSKFNQKLVSKYLIQIKNGDNKFFDKDALKVKVFILMGKIVIKSINNFYSLINKNEFYPKEKVIHTEHDIMIECYIVFDNCIKNLQVGKSKNFAFYFNNALNRAMFRIYNLNYNKYTNTIENNENNEFILENIKGDTGNNIEFYDVDLKDFSEMEMEIVKSKLAEEKPKDFMKRKGISTGIYYENLDSIKSKLKNKFINDSK